MEYNPWVRDMFVGIKYASVFMAFLEYPLINKFVMSLAPKLVEQKMRDHFKFCRYPSARLTEGADFAAGTDRVDRRMEKGITEHPDFWSLVLRAQENKRGLSRDEMHANSQVLMTAGTETTATLLSGITYFLCKHPASMKRLCEEIRGAFKTSDEMSLGTLPDLKYLHACLEEALRLYPPAAVGLPREWILLSMYSHKSKPC